MKVLFSSFNLYGVKLDFDPRAELKVTTTLYRVIYKQCHMKVLLNSFHLNGQTLGFHPQISS